MKKSNRKPITSARPTKHPMRREYDFSGGVRGRYAVRYAAGTNLVFLEDDVFAAFPDADAVNAALRALLTTATPPLPTAPA